MWSKEYKEATKRIIESKEAEIAALKTQLELLKSFSSDKMRDIMLATKEALESEIERLSDEVEKKEHEISIMKQSDKFTVEKVNSLNVEKLKHEGGIAQLEKVIKTIDDTSKVFIEVDYLLSDPKLSKKIIGLLNDNINRVRKLKAVDKLCFLYHRSGPTGVRIIKQQLEEATGISSITIDSQSGEIRGEYNQNDHVILVDDYLTSGTVLRKASELIRKKGLEVFQAFVILCNNELGMISTEKSGLQISALAKLSNDNKKIEWITAG